MRRLTLLTLPLALAALTAAPAGAAQPMPGQTYEGPGPKGGSDVILVVAANGARVERLSLGYERGCRVNGRRLRQEGSIFVRNVRIRNGRFSWHRATHYAATGGSTSQTVKGRFVDGGTRFVATVRELTVNPKTHVRCATGSVPFNGAVPERELVNGKWAGSTGQGRPLTMTIGDAGVEAVAFDVTLTCGNGEQITRAVAPLTQPGTVSESDLSFSAGSWVGDTRISVTGTAHRGRISGTITASDAITRADGDEQRTYSCSSGDVTFEARPA